ncbi:MAG: ATP-binding protein [Propionivibrio sp.]|nr:ATP-binding protein [Propionivibrio sp.]
MAELLDRTFPARTEDLSAVRAAVREACQRAHCTEEASEQVVLAINEACMNIIKHGYGFAAGQGFTLRMGVNDDVLMVQLLDNGLPAKMRICAHGNCTSCGPAGWAYGSCAN